VLLVEPSDYNACDTSSYDKKFQDGSTSFALDRSGAFFFISGVDANCRANAPVVALHGPRSDLGFEGCCFKFCGLRAYCMFRSSRGEEAWPYPQTQGADRLRPCSMLSPNTTIYDCHGPPRL
jgi:hypothetical protein